MAKVALLIGVSEYGPGLNPLPGAVRAVESVRQILQPIEMGGFDEVKQLWNPNPPVMREAMETLFSGRTENDLVLLFFSGYIVWDDSGKLYFATAITRKSPRAELIRVSSIPVSFVQDLMSNSPCQHQVVILDCCSSCASSGELATNDDVVVDIKTQLEGKGRTILTSFSSTQNVLEPKASSHSLYTHYLVEGVTTGAADIDSDGWISIDELHEYASTRTQIAAPAVKLEFYSVENEDKILLSQVPIDDPKLKYRTEVERWVSDGEIPEAGRDRLDNLAESLGLTFTACRAIEDEILKPYHEYRKKLQRYKQELVQAICNDYPLSTQEREEFRILQQSLGLRDEDVEPIKEQMMLKLANLPQSENKADELAKADSESTSNSVPLMSSSVLPDEIEMPSVQPTTATPESAEEAEEPTLIQSRSQPQVASSSTKTVMQQTKHILPEPTDSTAERADEAEEPTLIQSRSQPQVASSSAKTVLQQTTRLLPEPTDLTAERADEAEEPTLIQSRSQPQVASSSAKTVLQQTTRLLPEPTDSTADGGDEAEEPTLIQSRSQPQVASSSAKTVLQQTTRLLPEPTDSTADGGDEAEEPTLIQSRSQPQVASSSAKTVLQQTTRLLPEPTDSTAERADEAEEPTLIQSHSQPQVASSSRQTVLQQTTHILPDPVVPTPTVKSSSFADSKTNSPSVSPFPNKLLLAIGIAGILATLGLAIGISSRKPVAPSPDSTERISSSPNPSQKPSSTTKNSDKEASSSPTESPKSKDCTIFVNGNVRSTPVSDQNNVVESLRDRLSVTGKRTEEGWVQVKLPSGKLAWAHPGIISDSSEKEMEACLSSKGKTE